MVQISATCSTNVNGLDFVAKSWIAIPCDEISMCLRISILRFPTLQNLLTRVHLRFMAMISPQRFLESQGLDSIDF
jgi:hypothetical protein